MIVESAALYTATGIAQIIAIPTNPTVQVGISGLYGVMPVRLSSSLSLYLASRKQLTQIFLPHRHSQLS